MKIIVSIKMRRKLKELAGLLPQPTHRIFDGMVVKSDGPINHYNLILKAYRKHGREGVEKYVADFQDEWTKVREFFTTKNED